MGTLYMKIEKAVNLNRNECFPSSIVYDDAETVGLRTVKTEMVSDSDSNQSNQNHENVFAITVNTDYDDVEYPRLAHESANPLNDLWKCSNQREQSHGLKQTLQYENAEPPINQSKFVMTREEQSPSELVQTPLCETPADQSTVTESPRHQWVQIRHVEPSANQSCLETNHNNYYLIPTATSSVREQSGVFSTESNGGDLSAHIPQSPDKRICPHVLAVTSPNSPPEQYDLDRPRADANQTSTIQDDRASWNSSVTSLAHVGQNTQDCVKLKVKNSTNSLGEQNARKRSDGGDTSLNESYVDSSNKKPKLAISQRFPDQDNSKWNIPQCSPPSAIQNDDERLSFRSELNESESVSSLSVGKTRILETLCSLQKSFVSIVAQQRAMMEQLADTEEKRLAVRLKEAEVELLKQGNEKERMAMEERQRREDREHHYKVMQLIMGRLGVTSLARGNQNVNDGHSVLNK